MTQPDRDEPAGNVQGFNIRKEQSRDASHEDLALPFRKAFFAANEKDVFDITQCFLLTTLSSWTGYTMASDVEKPNMNLASEPREVDQDGIYSDENPENAVAEHRKQSVERQKEAQQLVSDIKDLIQSGTDRTNEQIRLKEEQLRQVLDIPPDKWIQPSDTTSMQTVISRFDRYFSDMNTVLNNKEEWTASQLVANASDGAALRGVLVGEIDEPKNIVLSTPEKVTLMSPNMQQISEIKVNSSKEQSDRFLKGLDMLGYSVAASEQSQESQSPTQSTFLSQVMYTFVPTAAVAMRPKDLRFSEQALQELKKVDEAVKACDDKEAIRSTCEQFFELYGSHVNAGLIHFGGVSKLVATYSSETESDIDTTRSMVNEALNAYASMSYSGSEVSVDGSISGDAVELQRSISSSYSSSELAKIQLLTCNNGGPYEVNTLPLWRMGLITHNSTWALIDRGGRSSTDFVGIWELLPNHEEFDNPHVLASTLKNALKQKQGITNGDRPEHLSAVRQMDEMEKEVAKWVSDPTLTTCAIDYVRDLVQTVESTENSTGSRMCWTETLCKKDGFCGAFLVKLVNIKDQLPPKDVPMIQYMIRKLDTSADRKHFEGRDEVMGWVSVPKENDIDPLEIDAEINNIPDLLEALKEKMLPTLQCQHAKHENSTIQTQDSIDAQATVETALMVNHMLESLSSQHELLFAHACLLGIEYDRATMKFETMLNVEKLKQFVCSLEGEWQKFQSLTSKGETERDAYLIHLLLQSPYIQTNQPTKEEEFNDFIRDIRRTISPQVNQVLNTYAISPFKWEKLTEVTGQMAQSDFSFLEQKTVDLHKLRKVLVTSSPETNFGGQSCCEEKMHAAFKQTVTNLGLDKHYPRRISLQQATTITSFPAELKPHDLPWKLLQMLIMLDYCARDILPGCLQKPKVDDIDEDVNALDLGLSDDEGEDNGNLDMCPMDVLLATFSSCDLMLQQVIAHALFMCKQAIPFIYPIASPDALAFSLWALRNIVVEWRNNSNEAEESVVTDHPFPIVTFVRFGKPPLSKSKLLNDVLRDDTHHTFFSPECSNSTAKRTIADGMIECSWFLPSGKETDVFPKVCLMLNLRGDGSTYKRQMSFINKITSVIVVMANIEDIANRPHVDSFADVCKAGQKVVLLLTSERSPLDMKLVQNDWKNCVKHIGEENLKGIKRIITFKKGVQMAASDLKAELRKHVSKLLETCTAVSVEDAAVIAKGEGILVDEHDAICMEGKRIAETVMKHMEGKSIVGCKTDLLPLQGTTWFEYSTLLKKQHRADGKQKSLVSVADLQQKMQNIRQKQLEICKSLTPFCDAFLTSLLQTNDDGKLFVLQWMKLLLDDKSRFHLPKLHQKYGVLWSEFQKAKTKRDTAEMKRLQSEVSQAEKNLADASFGLENLFRELGQIYEAINESALAVDKESLAMIEQLPEVAASLLLRGNPLELVDGDASNVPLTWLKAVLSKLESLIGDAKLFVVSVLGIQSSGKSTLLNTMFGLKFAVSAGRCTRGAFMQVIKVNDPDLPMDYIAVVDTEGLRAPELAQAKYNHDNELATLAIGLADLTLMNIKGENTAEVKDILQIAVHAFMRMKLVNKNLNKHQSCFFIHQNVPAVNAKEKMMHGCQKLQENLDTMTQEAAEGEKILDIQSFSQIIGFDVQDHVWHFLDLWHGNPPMAPANPGYSRNVNAVRSNLLGRVANAQKTFLTTSDFSVRIEDLWKGILADDFVFSFRNSLEVKAYNSMEAKYYELEWELQSAVMSWMQKAENKMRSCETVDDLEMCLQGMFDDLNKVINTKLDTTRKSLEEYFEKSNLQDIMIQWQQAKLNALHFDADKRHTEGKKHLLAVKEAHRVDLLRRTKLEKHKSEITSKAVELADQLKGKETSDEKLRGKFNEMWIPMVNELASKYHEENLPMDTIVESILWSRFNAHRHLLDVELQRNPLGKPINLTSLEKSIKMEYVHETDISLMSTYLDQIKKVGSRLGVSKHPKEVARHKVVLVTRQILQDIDVHLKDLCSQDIKFQESLATNVIRMLTQGIEHFNENKPEDCHFSILPRYTVKLAVHVGRQCVQLFTQMQDKYEKKNGIVTKLEEYKETTWNLFKHTVKQSTEEVVAADLFCSHLKEIITKTVTKHVPQKIVDEIVRDFSNTKHHLILGIMEDLANKGNFDSYSSYIVNAKTFALQWITEYTKETLFSVKPGRKMSRYGELTKAHIQTITRCITTSVEKACEKVMDLSKIQEAPENVTESRISEWTKAFCEAVKEDVPIGPSSLDLVATRNIADFTNFQRLILKQLSDLENTLITTFSEHKAESMQWEGVTPYQQIMDELWGCPAQCPFCCEPCSQTATDHYTQSKKSHTCLQHRPDGIGGARWGGFARGTVEGVPYQSGELSSQICNYNIQWKGLSFGCSICHNECQKSGKCNGGSTHQYLEYKKYLPEWDIAPDSTNSASVYWSWFMATYPQQLTDMYDAKLPSIPSTWSSYTKEAALKDLRKTHN